MFDPILSSFSSISGRRSIEGSEKTVSFPEKIRKQLGNSQFRGLLLGSGMPDEMLFEILLDPEDFLQEVPLK